MSVEYFNDYFFVVGKSSRSGRHFSENITDFHVAFEAFNLYCDMIKHFGGGTVDLFHVIDDDNVDIIEHKLCI